MQGAKEKLARKNSQIDRLSHENDQLRDIVKSLTDEVTRMRIHPPREEVQNQASCEVFEVLSTICNVTRLPGRVHSVITRCNTLHSGPTFYQLDLDQPAENLLREILIITISEVERVPIETVKRNMNCAHTECGKYFEFLTESLILRNGQRIKPRPDMIDSVRMSLHNLSEALEDQFGISRRAEALLYRINRAGEKDVQIATMLTRMAVMVKDIYFCDDWVSVIDRVVSNLILTLTPKDISKLFSGVSGLYSYLRDLVIGERQVENQSFIDDARDMIRAATGFEKKIPEIPLFNFIDQVITLVVYHFVDPDYQAVNPFIKGVLERTKKKSYTWDAVLDRILECVDFAFMLSQCIVSGVDYSKLIDPTSVPMRIANIEGKIQAFRTGALGALDSTNEETPKFIKEVNDLRKDISDLIEKKAIHPKAMTTYTQYLAKAMKLDLEVKMIVKSRQPKPSGLWVCLYGEPGVGKSALNDHIQAVVATANECEILEQHEWNVNEDPNGWDNGANSQKRFLRQTEHLNTCTDTPFKATLGRINELNDTNPSMFNAARAEEKGNLFNFLLGGVINCNIITFGAELIWTVPEAGSRRCEFAAVTVKDEYAKTNVNGTKVPDATKIPKIKDEDGNWVQIQDTHWIHRYKLKSAKVKGDKGRKSKNIDIEWIGERMEVSEYLRYLLQKARQNIAESTEYNKYNQMRKKSPRCRSCASPKVFCQCSRFDPPGTKIVSNSETESRWNRWKEAISGYFATKTLEERLEKEILDESSSPKKEVENQNFLENDDPSFLEFLNNAANMTIATTSEKVGDTVLGVVGAISGDVIDSSCMQYLCYKNICGVSLFVSSFLTLWGGAFVLLLALLFKSSLKTTARRIVRARVERAIGRGTPFRFWTSCAIGAATMAGLVATLSFHMEKKRKAAEEQAEKIDMIADATQRQFLDERMVDVPLESDEEELLEKAVPPTIVINQGTLNPSSEEEVRDRLAEENPWLSVEKLEIETDDKLTNMTYEQTVNRRKNNFAKLIRPDGSQKLFFWRNNMALTTVHRHELSRGSRVFVERGCDTRNIREMLVLGVHRIKDQDGRDTDMCAIALDCDFGIKNVKFMFPKKIAKTPGISLLECKDPQVVNPQLDSCRTEDRGFTGYKSLLKTKTVVGDCTSLLVTKSSPHVIIGCHVSLSNEHDVGQCFSCCVPISQKILTEAEESLAQFVRVNREFKSFDNVPEYLTPKVENQSPHERSCVRFLRNVGPECTTNFPSVEWWGCNDKLRARYYSQVEITEFSEHLEEAGWSREHGKPNLNTNRTAAEYLQKGARGWRQIPLSIIDAVADDYIDVVATKMKEVNLTTKMLSPFEMINGRDGHRFIKPMITKTAAGGGMAGKKISHMILHASRDYSEWDREDSWLDDLSLEEYPITFDTISRYEDDGNLSMVPAYYGMPAKDQPERKQLKEILLWDVRRGFEAHQKGESFTSITWCALKDEPTKFKKVDKNRNMGSQSLIHHCCHRMYFTEVQSNLKSIPLVSGCLEGVGSTTEEWEQILHWLMEIPGYQFFAGDFVKMDMALQGQNMRTTGYILSEIAAQTGASPAHVTAIKSRVCDMATGFWNWHGDFIRIDASSSGNILTVTFNNIGGVQIPTRFAYVVCKWMLENGMDPREEIPSIPMLDSISYKTARRLLKDFVNEVRIGSVGDDSIGSTNVPQFTMNFMSRLFHLFGVGYTDAAKNVNVTDFTPREELEFCKRSWRWDDIIGHHVAPLDLSSIGKSMHCKMPSATAEIDVVTGNIREALRELSRHGQEVFELRAAMIRKACESIGYTNLIPELAMSYEDWAKTCKKDYKEVENQNDPTPCYTAQFLAALHKPVHIYGVELVPVKFMDYISFLEYTQTHEGSLNYYVGLPQQMFLEIVQDFIDCKDFADYQRVLSHIHPFCCKVLHDIAGSLLSHLYIGRPTAWKRAARILYYASSYRMVTSEMYLDYCIDRSLNSFSGNPTQQVRKERYIKYLSECGVSYFDCEELSFAPLDETISMARRMSRAYTMDLAQILHRANELNVA